jgi:hypothetical protein
MVIPAVSIMPSYFTPQRVSHRLDVYGWPVAITLIVTWLIFIDLYVGPGNTWPDLILIWSLLATLILYDIYSSRHPPNHTCKTH